MKIPEHDPGDIILPIPLSRLNTLIIEAVTMGVMLRDARMMEISPGLRFRLAGQAAGTLAPGLVGDAVIKLLRDYPVETGAPLVMYDLNSEKDVTT